MKRITANQYQTSERYYKSPKILFEDEKYMDMKLEVKVVYSILKDRLELSLSRGWIDEEGVVYLVFSNSKLMRLLGCSKSKLLSIKKTLKEYDLIDEVQQSSSEKGRLANKIYLGELSSTPVASSNRPIVKKRLGEFKVTFLDDYHKKYNYPLFYESYLQNVMEFLESQDIKKGVDAFVDNHQNLVFILYGQGYRAEGREGILTTQVTVKAYDEDKKSINFSNLLDSLIVSEYQMEANQWEVSHD